nr:unnamed protein product [Callosobruchus analis]
MIRWRHIDSVCVHLEGEGLLTYVQQNRLVRRQLRCAEGRCRRTCTLQKRAEYVLGVCFRCPACRSSRPILTGSFFVQMHTDVRAVLLLMWVWAGELRTGQVVNILSESKVTVVQYYRYFRGSFFAGRICFVLVAMDM